MAFLLDALDEIDLRQSGDGIMPTLDWRVKELINLGDAAVPDLIGTLESDGRLTRSVLFGHDFSRARKVFTVRGAAIEATASILGTREFEPRGSWDLDDQAAKETAKSLRDYWKTYGHFPFDERMMKILADPKESFTARRKAAKNLSALNEQGRQTALTFMGTDLPHGENPAVKKFNNPTVAEAMLATMDADLNAHDYKQYERRGIQNDYARSLTKLGDTRIAPEVAKRVLAAKTLDERFVWAVAAHRLGEGKPFEALANEFRAGKISISEITSASTDHDTRAELRYIVGTLISAGTTAANNALHALVDPKHPEHDIVTTELLRPAPLLDSPLFTHPYCISILRVSLNDETPTGGVYTIENDKLFGTGSNGGFSMGIPSFLADPSSRYEKINERRSGNAAEKISRLMFGAPLYHPLLKDSGQQLAKLKSTIEQIWRQSAPAKHTRNPRSFPSVRCVWGAIFHSRYPSARPRRNRGRREGRQSDFLP